MAEQSKTAGIKKFWKDTINELKKVIWPDKKRVMTSTGAVIGSVAAVGIFIWVADAGLHLLISKFILGLE